MNLKKEIRLAKYLLPISAGMLLLGLILWLVAFFVLATGRSFNLGWIVAIDIFVGSVLFVVGIVDRALTQQRDKIVESKLPLSVKIGLISILIVATLYAI